MPKRWEILLKHREADGLVAYAYLLTCDPGLIRGYGGPWETWLSRGLDGLVLEVLHKDEPAGWRVSFPSVIVLDALQSHVRSGYKPIAICGLPPGPITGWLEHRCGFVRTVKGGGIVPASTKYDAGEPPRTIAGYLEF